MSSCAGDVIPAPTLAKHARCDRHPWSLLNEARECPTCHHDAHAATQRTPEAQKELRRIQTLERARKRPPPNYNKNGGW